MSSAKRSFRLLIGLGVVLLQLIMTQVVTFVFSMFFPGFENFPQTNPVIFVAVLGIAFTIGVFSAGWLALKQRWLTLPPKYPARLAATLICAYLPLLVALMIYHPLEPGNPFFFISELAAVLGFYLPGWIGKST